MQTIPADKLTDIPNISGWYGESFYEGDTSKSYFAGLCYFFVKQNGLELIIENEFTQRNGKKIKSTHCAKFTFYFPDQNVAEIIFDSKTPLNSLDRYYEKLYLYVGKQMISTDFNPYSYFFMAVPIKKNTADSDFFIQLLYREILLAANIDFMPVPLFNSIFKWEKDFERIEMLQLNLANDFIILKGNLKDKEVIAKIEALLDSSSISDKDYQSNPPGGLTENVDLDEFCKPYKIEFYSTVNPVKEWEWKIEINLSRNFVFIESIQTFYPEKRTTISFHQVEMVYYFEEKNVLAVKLNTSTPLKKADENIYEIFLAPKEKMFYLSYTPYPICRDSFPLNIEYQLVYPDNFHDFFRMIIGLLTMAYSYEETRHLRYIIPDWEKTSTGRKAIIGDKNKIYLELVEETIIKTAENFTYFLIKAQNLRPYEETWIKINSKNTVYVHTSFKKDVKNSFENLVKFFSLRNPDKEMEDYREMMREMSKRAEEGEKFM